MIVLSNKFKFSVQQLLTQRFKFQHKICYRSDRSELRGKSTPTIALSSRLFRDGRSLSIYKNCNKFFLQTILSNVRKLAPNNEFKNLFYQYQSFTDFNRVLFWRINSINTIFNLKKLKTRKLLYYLRPERRVVVVLFWLKFIIKMKKKDRENNNPQLFQPLINFICANKSVNEVHFLKLKIYKLRVLRG